MDSTCLVFAGFGDRDYFPVYVEYACYGVLLGKFVYDVVGSDKVDRDTTSCIKPFATTAMVNTFVVGFSPDVFSTVRKATDNALMTFATELAEEHGFDVEAKHEGRIRELVKEHTDTWANEAVENHTWPLRRVIGSLPVDEMAELAETLIMLESLKEKVTRPTESVGGPIDVCVISKAEGLVWTKRKHYFEAELNPQFFRRQASKLS